MSKHLLNTETLVADALRGLALLNPATEVDTDATSLFLRDLKKDRVHVLSGGVGGHESAHASFVGEGLLSAAVSGPVFTSPNSRQVEKALVKLARAKGTVLIVSNTASDVIQFGVAKERWAANHPGEDTVRVVVVGDDVAIPRSQEAITGRRGLSATVLVYKVAGALAATGASIDEVEHLARIVAERSGTISVGFKHSEDLGDDEAEIGVGSHNESGNKKISPVPLAAKLVDELLATITDRSDKERGYLPFQLDGKDEVVLLINNLGGLADVALSVVLSEACEWLAAKKIVVERAISGTFFSSLNLSGFSISLVLLPREAVETPISFTTKLAFDKDLIISTLDAPTQAPGWRWHYKGRPQAHFVDAEEKKAKAKLAERAEIKGLKSTDPKLFLACLEAALRLVIKAEPEITRFDSIAGDGDAGRTLRLGAEAIQAKLNEEQLSSTDVVSAMITIAEVADISMPGTSGGLYTIFFAGLAKGLREAASELQTDEADAKFWARGLELALNSLYLYTRARPPSRTLVDPLSSFIITFAYDPTDLRRAFAAGMEAVEATRSVDAKAGRAASLDKDQLSAADVPDAGAEGVKCLLQGIRDTVFPEE